MAFPTVGASAGRPTQGTSITSIFNSGEEQPIFSVRVSDHKVEQVTSTRQILRADVLSYTMTRLPPDNAPLASLVHNNSDIFALELDLP